MSFNLCITCKNKSFVICLKYPISSFRLAPVLILSPVLRLHSLKCPFRADMFMIITLTPNYWIQFPNKIFLFLHKYDTEDYQKELLDTNVKNAKEIFLDLFKDYDFDYMLTSIYEQDKLAKVFRDVLISEYAELKSHVEKAEKQLDEIKAKVIIADISGNVIVHNVQGVSSGLTLRGDLRDFINACNTVRENIFMADSSKCWGRDGDGKEIELHIFKYIISVLVMKSGELDRESQDKLNMLLNDMKLFADLIISAHTD